jgi:hypothetical protein
VKFFNGFGEGDFEGMNDWEEKEVLLDGVDGLGDAVVVAFVVEAVDVVDACVPFLVDGIEFVE